MYKDKTQLRKDGHRTIESGMNSGRDPTLLTEQECAFSSNVTFRGGYPTNRQKWVLVELFDGGNAAGGTMGGMKRFQNGFYQGGHIYDINDTEQHILAMVDGRLIQIDIGTGLTLTTVFYDGLSNAGAPQVWMTQADVYFVIQDGTSTPIVMQGLTPSGIRRANSATHEVPVGQAMTYGQGRLWVTQGRQVIAGDLLGGPTSVISFTENIYLGEAAFFGVPLSCGNVIGLIFAEQGDTATGQGQLLMFARQAAYSIQAGVPRQATQTQLGWQGTPNMQSVALVAIGGTGARNLLNVNQDVFFRSKDGWRTYRTARNEQFGWGGAPISNEMLRITAYDSLTLLDYASSALFKNRVFLCASPTPYKTFGAAAFNNLIVLDLNVVSSVINKSNLAYEFSPYFTQRGSPAYDGVWQPPAGRQIVELIQGVFNRVERMFAICYNPASVQNEIWELVDNEAFDNQNVPVVSQIETKAYDFKLPDTLKELRKADIYFTAVDAPIQLTVEFRSDSYPNWIPWVVNATLPSHAQPCNLDTQVCQSPGCPVEGYWMPVKLPTPPNTCDQNTGKLIRVGYYFQLRITWTGPATMHMVILHAEELVEDPNGSCPSLLPYNPALANPVL